MVKSTLKSSSSDTFFFSPPLLFSTGFNLYVISMTFYNSVLCNGSCALTVTISEGVIANKLSSVLNISVINFCFASLTFVLLYKKSLVDPLQPSLPQLISSFPSFESSFSFDWQLDFGYG